MISGYRDLEVIGHGASATVYRATQEAFGRTVAIKVLHVDVSDRKAQRRFEREKAINGRLSHHPNVVTVLESGFVDGRYPYLAMEFFERGSLSGRLAERGPFDIDEALHIGIRIAGALESAHGMGIVHRDVKPQNILLSRFGEPALADFGVATILELEQSVTAGLTPVHAAPEILEGADPSPASDVYALGSTVYTLLSGAPPFAGPPGEGVLAQLLRITTMELPAMGRDDVPASVLLALREATAKRPEDRTPTAAAFGRLLQMAQDDLGLGRTTLPLDVPADVPPPPHRPAEGPPAAAAPSWSPPTAPAPSPAERSSPPLPPALPMPLDAPVPASPPTRPAVDASGAVVDGADEHPTVSARQQHPLPTQPRRSRRWVGVAAVSAVAIAVGAVAATAYTNGRQWTGEVAPGAVPADSTEGPGSTEPEDGKNDFAGTAGGVAADTAADETVEPTAATSVATTTDSSAEESTVPTVPDDPDVWAPQDVRVTRNGATTVVHWTDASGGFALHVIDADRPPPDWVPVYENAGRDFSVLDVDPDLESCFQVRAVLAIGVPTGDDEVGFAVGEPEWACPPGVAPLDEQPPNPT